VSLTDAVLGIDPLNEEAVRYQMQAHARGGHLELAARSYRRHHNALRDELGEEPSAVVREEYARVLSGAALDG